MIDNTFYFRKPLLSSSDKTSAGHLYIYTYSIYKYTKSRIL